MPEGYHDFVAGEDLTAVNLESYCELQAIMRFASAAARDTALSAVKTEGMCAYTIDTDTLWVYSGAAWIEFAGFGAWLTYTPTWSGTLGNGAISGGYRRYGRTIHYRASVIWGSTTSHAGANQSLTLPVAPNAGYKTNSAIGQVSSYDVSALTFWHGSVIAQLSSTTVFFVGGVNGNNAGFPSTPVITNAIPMTWATGDELVITGTFEAAS